MSSSDRAAGARLLRRLREGRGWSWTDMARALRTAAAAVASASTPASGSGDQVARFQRSIARWESPTDGTGPGHHSQLLLAHLFARTPAGAVVLGPGSDFDTLLIALQHFGVPPHRIEQLTSLITPADINTGLLSVMTTAIHPRLVTVLDDPTRVNDDILAGLANAVSSISEQIGSGTFAERQSQLAPIVTICRRLAATAPTRHPKQLLALTTDTLALAARLAFETRDDRTAIALYGEATAAAVRQGDHQRRAAVRTSHAMVTLHSTDELEAARAIAQAAAHDARAGPSHAIRARAHAVNAEICAYAGDGYRAQAELERAWTSLDRAAYDDPYKSFTASRLDGFVGLCALHTGDPERARDRLDRSLAALVQQTDAVQYGIVCTDLARAHLRSNDPLTCVDLLHTAVDAAAKTGGRVPALRIRQVRRELRPWRTEDFVGDLDEHIYDALLGR